MTLSQIGAIPGALMDLEGNCKDKDAMICPILIPTGHIIKQKIPNQVRFIKNILTFPPILTIPTNRRSPKLHRDQTLECSSAVEGGFISSYFTVASAGLHYLSSFRCGNCSAALLSSYCCEPNISTALLLRLQVNHVFSFL
jgi:hypothetical protein